MRELFKRTVRTAVAMELVDLAVQAVDGSKVAANATRDRTCDAERGARLLNRLEKAIADLEAQNEAGEDTPAVHLPEELADQRALREQVRQAMDDLTSDRVFCQLFAPVPITPNGPDGMKVDVEGNIYSSGPGGVWIIDPAGNHLGTIHTGAQTTNVGWGGDDWKTLFVTTFGSLYRIQMKVAGIAVPGNG